MSEKQKASGAASAPPVKMAVLRGRQAHPLWVHLYGVEGVGKTTFAADAPGVVFVDVEKGTYEQDVARFVFDDTERTTPNDWPELLGALRALAEPDHEFKTVAVDTLDATEALIWSYICARDEKENIEGYGYGKGYVAALDEWRLFVAAVERIRASGRNVVTTAHSVIKAFKNPEGPDYDRYQMKMDGKAAGLIRERADVALFAQFETFVQKEDESKKKGRVRGVSTGSRLAYTQRTAAYDAKNRFDLPEWIPLSWADFEAGVKAHRPAPLAALVAEVERKATEIGGKDGEQIAAYLAKSKDNAAAVAKANDRANALLAAKREQEGN